MKIVLYSVLIASALITIPSRTDAQQITGTLGSPSATTTTGGKELPLPDPKFGGEIKLKASESTP